MVELKDNEYYFRLIQDFEYIPFTQTRAWYHFNTTKKASNIRFFIDHEDSPEIAFFGYVKQLLGIKILFIEGECFRQLPANSKKLKSFFVDLANSGYDVIEIDSSLQYDAAYEIGIRRAGFLRPVGLFSSSFSSLVNTKEPYKFDNNWKQNLKKAENSNLVFEFSETITKNQIDEFFEMYQEMLNRKKIGDPSKLDQFSKLIDQKGFGFCSIKEEKGTTICAILFYYNKQEGVDLYRVTSPEARSNGASFFIYQKLFETLAKIGIQKYDMGRLTPSTHSKDTVFTFKAGANGEFILYNGEWSWYKQSAFRPLMYFVKRFLMKKVEV